MSVESTKDNNMEKEDGTKNLQSEYTKLVSEIEELEKVYYLLKLEVTSLKCEKDFLLSSLDEIDSIIQEKQSGNSMKEVRVHTVVGETTNSKNKMEDVQTKREDTTSASIPPLKAVKYINPSGNSASNRMMMQTVNVPQNPIVADSYNYVYPVRSPVEMAHLSPSPFGSSVPYMNMMQQMASSQNESGQAASPYPVILSPSVSVPPSYPIIPGQAPLYYMDAQTMNQHIAEANGGYQVVPLPMNMPQQQSYVASVAGMK